MKRMLGMKRKLSIITALAIAFTFAACGQGAAMKKALSEDRTGASQEGSIEGSQLQKTAFVGTITSESNSENISNESTTEGEISKGNISDESTIESELSNGDISNSSTIKNDISDEDTTDVSIIKREIEKSKIDISAYISLIDEFEESEAESNDQSYKYGLIYFDSDDIQELFVWQDTYSSISVYTVNGSSKVICLVDNMCSVAPSYYERKGIIEQWSRWNGGGDEGSYAGNYYVVTAEAPYTDGRKPDFGYEYNAIYGEDGNWTGTGKTEYFSQGELITEKAYKKIFEAYQISEWSDDAEKKEEGRVGRREF